ncbi:hypothetical protein ACFYZH_03615 [Streptomyces abikoensis]|uniref:hypothetical protein n=1 Tax=Streptomyces abikoensis TaxID=97398 RepID=UPI00369693F4
MRVLAYMLQGGDVVNDGREEREVKDVRRRSDDVIVTFKAGSPLRVSADKPLNIQRGWSRSGRDQRR